MQTPEEFAADMHASMLSCDREELIRARDAEVRAETLKGFTEEWTVAATDWIEEAGHDPSREAAERKLRTSPKPAWLERRLVGPWESTERGD